MPDPYPEQTGANEKSSERKSPAEPAEPTERARMSQEGPYRVALCGQSIFLHTIKAALSENSTVEVLHLLPQLPSIVERITAWQPDLVLIERGDRHSELILALLGQGVPLVEMEVAANRGTFLIGEKISLANLSDLTQLLEKANNLCTRKKELL
ncbi:MAG: hypothetical protein GY832_17685 [Chloroflexi bacterium]|nr:hypothetical protein [Chloroflexota bacterium]